jgi:hypothetical protein
MVIWLNIFSIVNVVVVTKRKRKDQSLQQQTNEKKGNTRNKRQEMSRRDKIEFCGAIGTISVRFTNNRALNEAKCLYVSVWLCVFSSGVRVCVCVYVEHSSILKSVQTQAHTQPNTWYIFVSLYSCFRFECVIPLSFHCPSSMPSKDPVLNDYGHWNFIQSVCGFLCVLVF